MGLVTVFCPLRTIGLNETGVQLLGNAMFVADCNVKPVGVSGQVKMTLVPAPMMLSCGGITEGKERLNTVPLPAVPPSSVVPYNFPPDIVKPARGLAPSQFVFRSSPLKE